MQLVCLGPDERSSRIMLRNIGSKNRRMILLAPGNARIPGTFLDVDSNCLRYSNLLAEMQRLRGNRYLKDGAIEPWELSSDGRHQTPADLESWHLLALDASGRVCACARYRELGANEPISELSAAASPLAACDDWKHILFQAVAAEMELARGLGYAFVEVGGWALREDCRCNVEGVKIALSAYSLARMLGGCIGITTATMRHSSAAILSRIGGGVLQAGGVELPSYYDPRYKCGMRILRFDSRVPNPRYLPWIEQLQAEMASAPVVSARKNQVTVSQLHLSAYRQEYSLHTPHPERLETVATY